MLYLIEIPFVKKKKCSSEVLAFGKISRLGPQERNAWVYYSFMAIHVGIEQPFCHNKLLFLF